MIPVILSGGSGTRLWPLSREGFPKQFLSLVGTDSMLQATWNRVKSVASAPPIVVAGEDHRFMVAEQLREAGCTNATILLEPVARNTAPAIAVAALESMANGDDPILLVLPSDHVIENVTAFQTALQLAASAAEAGRLVTFGIVPNAAETGYGYIQAASGEGVRAVERFVEKPDSATAQKYVESGTYFWNSGMFMFKASAYIDALAKHQPLILEASRAALTKAKRDTDFIRLDHAAFESSPSDSIDYAVMEKTDSAAILPINVGWNDVGSWSALWEVAEQDTDGNAHHGDVIAEQCRNTLAWGDQRLVALLGLEDVVVVDTADAVLVAHKDKVQEVKSIVSRLKAAGRSEPSAHRKVYRPWGNYDSIDIGDRFQVKRISVKPGAQLSLQMHHHRAEHWIVVSGTGRVTRGEETLMLTENQSTYIPLGVKHRLENPGVVPLELIEVQSGSYLGEDDIVRFEDVYGRG